eukprot:2771528-Alexandrium_andersonii.AAC.1
MSASLVGSEMCIRDRDTPPSQELPPQPAAVGIRPKMPPTVAQMQEYKARRAMERAANVVSAQPRM